MRKHSEETKLKIGLGNRGKILSEETKQKIRIANIGKKYSDEVNKKKGKGFEKRPNYRGGISRDWTKYMRDIRLEKNEKIAGRKRPSQCEICGISSDYYKKQLCFDHDHLSGFFRGWICVKCNAALGMVDDNIKTLQAMIQYLINFNSNK